MEETLVTVIWDEGFIILLFLSFPFFFFFSLRAICRSGSGHGLSCNILQRQSRVDSSVCLLFLGILYTSEQKKEIAA